MLEFYGNFKNINENFCKCNSSISGRVNNVFRLRWYNWEWEYSKSCILVYMYNAYRWYKILDYFSLCSECTTALSIMRYQDDIYTEHNMKTVCHSPAAQWKERLTRNGQKRVQISKGAYFFITLTSFLNQTSLKIFESINKPFEMKR